MRSTLPCSENLTRMWPKKRGGRKEGGREGEKEKEKERDLDYYL